MKCQHKHTYLVDRNDPEAWEEAMVAFVDAFRVEGAGWSDADIRDAAKELEHGKCLDCGQYIARRLETPELN